jgi:hypothetical protein
MLKQLFGVGLACGGNATRYALVVSLLVTWSWEAAAQNSCANVSVIGTWDDSGLKEDDRGGVHAYGTFRIQDEADESKQPIFNLSFVDCQKALDYSGKEAIECKLNQSFVIAESKKPDVSMPNCFLDSVSDEYAMKVLQPGVLVGMPFFSTELCYDPVLTINKDTKRVYRSFIRSRNADKYEQKSPNACGTKAPPTQVLMNCTMWPRLRKGGESAVRYCDFSTASDKLNLK